MGINEIRAIKTGIKERRTGQRYRIPAISAKRAAKLKEEKAANKGQETALQKWYFEIMRTESPVCWESGEKFKTDRKTFIGCIAHVLPKSLFPSIATHPLNYMILLKWMPKRGAPYAPHSQYDSSWSAAEKMKVWPVAVDRFRQMYRDIAPEERKNIPVQLLKEL